MNLLPTTSVRKHSNVTSRANLLTSGTSLQSETTNNLQSETNLQSLMSLHTTGTSLHTTGTSLQSGFSLPSSHVAQKMTYSDDAEWKKGEFQMSECFQRGPENTTNMSRNFLETEPMWTLTSETIMKIKNIQSQTKLAIQGGNVDPDLFSMKDNDGDTYVDSVIYLRVRILSREKREVA